MNKVGIGVDFHSLVKGDHLIIGGHRIECEFSSQAHSDGDVLTHAIIDALLGALNLGDIGENFPNTSEYLNISSIKMLKKVVQKMPENTKIINIDASIVLNSPKISPYKNAIKESLSKALNVSIDSISVKGTTTNNLGFVDMSNGWGAQAILMIDDGN